MTASALYEGTLAHRRRTPVEHRLSYRVCMPLFDLDELPSLLDRHPLWSARRPAPVRFRASDYLHDEDGGGPPSPTELAERARELVAQRTGEPAPPGPVRLLTTPRFLGVGFNPVSFYFLYDDTEGPAQAVIAEVTNTPWGGSHSYAARRKHPRGPIEARFSKRLHVSPFNPMEQNYILRAGDPGEALAVSIANEQDGERIHDAGLSLRRREISRGAMTRMLLAYPPATIATLARIYAHGLRLKLKGVPHHPNPESSPGASAPTG
ncbi:MAG: DUF1365 domain-containing protein [Actinomycetota bacterium]|nr:DUF1365 domain-containing protein [Actinomycetota bacterium]